MMVLALLGLLTVRALASTSFEGPLPRVDAPLADPVVTADATFVADKATAWTQDDIQLLLLEGDVTFQLGTYGFRGQRVVVRVDTETRYRRMIRHLAIYFDQARTLHGAGRIQAEGPGLLVTASTTGNLLLDSSLLEHVDQAPDDPLVAAAAARIAEHRQRLADAAENVESTAAAPLFTPEMQQLRQQRRQQIAEQQLTQQVAKLPQRTDQPAGKTQEPLVPGAVDQTILPAKAVVQFTADRLWASAEQNVVSLVGNVRVAYTDYQKNITMTLEAQKAVIFIEGDVQGAVAGRQTEAAQVGGIYLEDNAIITDGTYTVRCPRAFYDPKRNKAVLLDAVMYTWDVKRQIPLYLRAQLVRQNSRHSFEADKALLTTSEFGVPHVAIGAERLTLEQPADSGGPDVAAIEHGTLRVNNLPVAYWPYAAIQNRNVPLRRASASYSDTRGPKVETTWDLFALAGKEAPEGVDGRLLLDYQGDHGPAVGLAGDYDRDQFFGHVDSYLLPMDSGEDDIGGRNLIKHDDDMRGFFHWQHRQLLEDDWELSLEGAYVSDETFLEEFFESQADEARTYETSIYFEKRMDEAVLSMKASYDLNNFTPQLTTLQSPGYSVDKLPELRYDSTGTSLFDDRVTWFSDNRISRMRINGGEDRPLDRGFRVPTSLDLFGFPRTTTFRDNLDAMGVPLGWVDRFDTRQELSLPLEFGPFNVTPYAVGRVTAYDEDFNDYSGSGDQMRLWGMVGTRISGDFHSEAADVESQILDIHRLRHVITPSLDIWSGYSTMNIEDLPYFDNDVERIDDATGVRLGLRNTLQTQRGGEGRWRSVDWIVLDTDLVLRGNDSQTDVELARYFDYRPELTTGSDHFYSRLLWMVTDAFALTGELTQNLEDDQTAQWRVGATMQHTPRLSTFIDYNELPILDSQLLTYGFDYQLTTKYAVGFAQRLDLSDTAQRQFSMHVERKLPRWRFLITASIDDIDNETAVGFLLIPEGLGGRTRSLRLIDTTDSRNR